jgi:ribosome maturation factor RimP
MCPFFVSIILVGEVFINLETKITEIIEPIIVALGYELWGCEVQQQGRDFLVRIYIDSPQGVDLDACGKVSHELGAILDVEDPMSGSYTLEVSSPGIERVLFKKEHYIRYIGSDIKLNLFAPVDKQKKFTGKIQDVKDDVLYFIVEDKVLMIPMANIAKASLVAEF